MDITNRLLDKAVRNIVLYNIESYTEALVEALDKKGNLSEDDIYSIASKFTGISIKPPQDEDPPAKPKPTPNVVASDTTVKIDGKEIKCKVDTLGFIIENKHGSMIVTGKVVKGVQQPLTFNDVTVCETLGYTIGRQISVIPKNASNKFSGHDQDFLQHANIQGI